MAGENDGSGLTGYLAAEGRLDELTTELGETLSVHGRLVLAVGPPRPAAWAQNIWYEPRRIAIASIGEGAKALRAMQRNWALYSFHLHRRAKLIQDKLPPLSGKPLVFPCAVPKAPLGSWTLLDEATILAAPHCSNPFPHGEMNFAENKTAPPNRAYLKLWEVFTLLQIHPGPGEICVDLGASPGGWTWVLQSLGATVIAVDKATLDPRIAALDRVTFHQDSAFAVDPAEFGKVDWLFSDVVCYPERLLGLIERWLNAGACRNMVCTIKFQGPTDHAIARRFAAIPGARLLHLFHNKHELTWIRLSDGAGRGDFGDCQAAPDVIWTSPEKG